MVFVISFFTLYVSISNFVYFILIIKNIESIYVFYIDDKNIKQVVETYKKTALIFVILALFFALVMYIVLWIYTSSKLDYLENTKYQKIDQQQLIKK